MGSFPAMTKSPSMLFNILQDDNEKDRNSRARQSIDDVRASMPGKGVEPVSDEQTARGGQLAKDHLGPSEAADSPSGGCSPTQEETPAPLAIVDGDIESVLVAMLGDLYVKYSTLSELELIGEGGFATVHKARLRHDNGLAQVVAVKALLEQRVNDSQDLREFIAEANLWRKLKSKDIIKLVGIAARDVTSLETVRSSLCLVCEHMEGGTLREAIERQMMSAKKQVYLFSDVLRWFVGIARAAKYLHQCRPAIVHRDLKPENVLLSSLDKRIAEAKVLDLGLHMRSRARTQVAADDNGSYYGGSMYDAVAFNGSVVGARLIGNRTLAEKVSEAEQLQAEFAKVSPPGTGTRHNSTKGRKSLHRIEEELPEVSRRSAVEQAAAAPPTTEKMVSPQEHTSEGNEGSGDASTKSSSAGAAALSNSLPLTKADASAAVITDQKPVIPAPVANVANTTKVGSWLYMAPEMVTGHIYTEKVDVFAIAVMLFEALRGRLNILHIALDGDPAAVMAYAEKVSRGFREPLPPNWPEPVKSLIKDGWHQDPALRITSAEFLERVSQLIDTGVGRHMDENIIPVTVDINDCGCGCSVM